MRPIAIVSVLSVIFMASTAFAGDKVGFKGVYIGQLEEDIPKSLKRDYPTYTGVNQGDYFQVWLTDKKVSNFSVVYIGESFERSAVSKQIKLSQALQSHSFAQKDTPKFALARGRNGQVWGLVDFVNAITYDSSDPKNPDSLVVQVGYIPSDAPVLNVRKEDKLNATEVDAIVQKIENSSIPTEEVAVIPFEERFVFESRKETVLALVEQSDIVIGKGKKTLALMSQVEAWLEVNENHDSAREVSHRLRQFYRQFKSDYDKLKQIYNSNENKLNESDFSVMEEPIKLNENIKRKMTQLKAMGFIEYGS